MSDFVLHKYQEKAFTSKLPIIIIAAGIQSGKTLCGALWLGNTAAKAVRSDNLIICAPTYKILSQATLPTFMAVYGRFGELNKGEMIFRFNNGPTVFIRSLTDPNAMEGITNVRGIWLDEGGLISRYAWENVMGRAAFRSAQVKVSTTPYSLNWLFELYKDWKAGKRDDVELVQFKSKDNPYFPDAEYERQRRLLDTRRFNMKYNGQFGRMEGLVYERINTCKAHELPTGTKFYGGIDWGYTNPFALTVRALTPDGIHYRVAEFMKSRMMIGEIIDALKARKQLYNIEFFVADPSNPANIEELNRAGLTCIPGNNNVRKGIDKQIELFKDDRFFIFEDENPMGLDEYNTYHYAELKDYKIDEDQKEQEPVKANDHSVDADRYITQYLVNVKKQHVAKKHDNKMPERVMERIEWLKRGGKRHASL